jgi:hypothetical protein
MNHQDQWTRWHDKPTDGVNPSSNNGWIYSAYAKYLKGDSIDRSRLLRCYLDCVQSLNPVMVNRSPYQTTPPFSKDEVIGCVSFGLLTDHELENSHYNFCNLDMNFERKLSIKSLFKAAKTLWNIRKEHRNYVWQNKMVEAYPLAFKLPPEDIYYVKKRYNKKPGILLTAAFYINSLLTIKKGDKSSRMMLWLKVKDLEMENTFIGKMVMKRYKKWVRDYFHKDHPFVKEL